MDVKRRTDEIDDHALDRQLRVALAVDPSPDFPARVRARIANQRRMGRWNPWWLDRRSTMASTGGLLFGPPNSTVTLSLRTGNRLKDVRLVRMTDYARVAEQRSGDIVKVLPGNIGYVDLDRLTEPMVGDLFERFRDTRAIIFDMRGYPRVPRQSDVAMHLTDQPSTLAAHFYSREPAAPDQRADVISAVSSTQTSVQTFSGVRDPYRGPTVMLIDERTQSAAEHLGLFLKAANRTTFVGSRTAGANGNAGPFRLPGDIAVSFSRMGVTHADGRQLQRVGLTPDVEVAPTREGLRAGKDEVLEAAIRYLNER